MPSKQFFSLISSPTEPNLALALLTKADLPFLDRWLREPHVMQWWDSVDTALPKIAQRLDNPLSTTTAYLMIETQQPIGYLQIYHANGDDFWAGMDLPKDTFGLDMFIGEPSAKGRTLGPRFLRMMRDHMFLNPRTARLHIDPDPANHAAIRAYEKAGFRPHGLIDTPDGKAAYMTINRPA